MKKNGFTLVELLGVIVVLSIIGLITVPIINNVLNDNVRKIDEGQQKAIVSAAKSYANANAFTNIERVTVRQLIDEGYLEETADLENYKGDCVKVTPDGSKYKFTFNKGCA